MLSFTLRDTKKLVYYWGYFAAKVLYFNDLTKLFHQNI